METLFVPRIAQALELPEHSVKNTLELFEEGATVPFIARYRKERTGSLDEVQIARIGELFRKYQDLQKRKETILATIEEQGKLTDELRKRIEESWEPSEVEDLYLPYRPKRRTRAQVARERGLEPLATAILKQRETNTEALVKPYVRGEVTSVEEAVQGAQDIIAEKVNEDEDSRNRLRGAFRRGAVIASKVVKAKAEEEGAAKYSDYFDWSEPLKRCSAHRLLAMRRGEAEGYLRISIAPEDEPCIEALKRRWVRGNGPCSQWVAEAVTDAYKRLLKPSIETEFAALSKEKADEECIEVFAENLRQLLLSPPLGEKRVMGIDPGFRTGCKVVCLDAQGNLLHYEAIYPHPPQSERVKSIRAVERMIESYKIEAIAIGNGTASRETASFVEHLHLEEEVQAFVVSEDGASVYSASKLGREEFPEYDVTVRGAVSIGRRLMDPLAELVKIDPKSIGVGQYQHDVDQGKLKEKLDRTVESCVNKVGVELNTASQHLLTYVSGLSPSLAKNIVDFRKEHGAFKTRNQLLKVPRLGPVAFQQCAGFLRIRGASNPLDESAVHPESYSIVEAMARDCGVTVKELITDAEKRKQIQVEKYVTETVGLPTLNDILRELEKPGRDPREQIEVFKFDDRVNHFEDLYVGMELPGIVTNVTRFGAFVDVGVHQDGLVHISQLADRFVSDPNDVVRLHQHVRVRVLEVDEKRRRIAFTMRGVAQ